MSYGNSVKVLYPILSMRWSRFNSAGVWKHRARSSCTSSCKLIQRTSCDPDLQLLHCHGQLFFKLSFAEALERNGSWGYLKTHDSLSKKMFFIIDLKFSI